VKIEVFVVATNNELYRVLREVFGYFFFADISMLYIGYWLLSGHWLLSIVYWLLLYVVYCLLAIVVY
jgi:hypothetical protein